MNVSTYLFTSDRLGFRGWKHDDLHKMMEINSDPEVMEFFPSEPGANETKAFIDRMTEQYSEKGYCYYAVDILEKEKFIGFLGLSEPSFEADFTPCVDIGWRLNKAYWGMGYATEGALRCLDLGFNQFGLESIKSIAPEINHKSINVMKRIGMSPVKTFQHPLLKGNKALEMCVLYEISKEDYQS